MRYMIEVKDEKLHQDKGYYYVMSSDGGRGVVDKGWIRKNIDYISNASMCRNRIYMVKDKFERAVEIIKRDMVRRMKSKNGFDFYTEYKLMSHEQDIVPLTKLPAKATARQAWDFISHYGVDKDIIFKGCLMDIQREHNCVVSKQSGISKILIVNKGE